MARIRFWAAVTLLALAGCSATSHSALPNPVTAAVTSRDAARESILHFFSGRPDGAWPNSGRLVADRAGNLYGATIMGGSGSCRFRGMARGCGVVFELVRSKRGQWSERVLYSFKSLDDGAVPRSTLTIDPNGNIYGVTIAGGNHGCAPRIWNQRGCGTVFELTRGHSNFKKRTIYVFSGNAGGGHPTSSLVLDSSGNLFGTTLCGGAESCNGVGAGAGVFFMLQQNGSGAWQENVLHIFGQTRGDGAYPGGDLTRKGTQTIYGVTAASVYEMTRTRKSQWRETTLFLFNPDESGGFSPEGAPVFDAAGNLYGVTYGGGNLACPQGCGVVYELTPWGSGTWSETVLYEFSGGSDGAYPEAGLALDAAGRLDGTTINGGDLRCNQPLGCGVVFRVRPSGTRSVETVLHSFQGGATDGWLPLSAVTLDSAGAIYGTTQFGGPASGFANGTAYRLKACTSMNTSFTAGNRLRMALSIL
jgi:uncharacterized repeat protein (TIGR03803 family)